MFKWLFGKKGESGGQQEAGGNAELLIVSARVNVPAEKAFSVFVDDFNTWWPRSYTFGGSELAEIRIEPKAGGRAYERTKDGAETVWGTVLSFFRPNHLVLAWQISPDRTIVESEATASRVDVRFVETEPGKSEVMVVHRDFPRHGDGWEKYRKDMGAAKGWPMLIEAYAKAVGSN